MKKIFAILLFSVYLFNLAGYSLLFDYFINRTDEQMAAALDNGDYSEETLTEIKVPVNMPYSRNQMEFERWDGEIEINGIHYNYVGRKMYNDTLYLFCIPNVNKTQLHNAKTAQAASVNDVTTPSSDKKQDGPFAKKGAFENEYDQPASRYIIFIAVASPEQHYILFPPLLTCFIDSAEQPPDPSC